MRNNNEDISKYISDYVTRLFDLYLKIDNSLTINNKKINLKSEKIKRVSLDNDVDFYFNFFNAVSEYRERIKESIANSNIDYLNGQNTDVLFVESRIKNINSIFSKIYQYINKKEEKGDVSINKCINDLFGMRIVVPMNKLSALTNLLNELSNENGWNCRIIDATKQEYKAIHMYLMKDNYSLRWEIQFWLSKDDQSNRESHARYKQAYTSWESTYSKSDLIGVCKS